jgi:hypothetical protein
LIAPDTPAGNYRIGIGLYDPTSGQRIVTSDDADVWLLDTVVQVR